MTSHDDHDAHLGPLARPGRQHRDEAAGDDACERNEEACGPELDVPAFVAAEVLVSHGLDSAAGVGVDPGAFGRSFLERLVAQLSYGRRSV